MLIVYNETCSDTTTSTIPILHEELFIPNIFAPDADNSDNNRFRVYGTGITSFEITIYNRNGAKVFHSTDINQGWDGSLNGKPCPQSAYIYRIRYATISHPQEPKALNGSVVLLK